MGDSSQRCSERRQSPRFACGGRVRIASLPMEGVFRPGRLRDLSLGGCCVETAYSLQCGSRAELVIRVNAASFRALGQVKAIREFSGAGLEFLQLTASGREILRELLAELATISALHGCATGSDAALSHQEEQLRLLVLSGRFPILRTAAGSKPAEGAELATDHKKSVLELPAQDISVDLLV